MHLEWHRESEDRSQSRWKKETLCVCVCMCFVCVCEVSQMKGLEGPGYMYIYTSHCIHFRAGWPILCHTQRCFCGITDRPDGPFHKGKGKGEDGTGMGEGRERRGG